MTSCNTFRHRTNYADAKEETVAFFEKKKDEFLSSAHTIRETNNDEEVEIQGITTIFLDDSNGIINYRKDGYGLITGGQCWGVYYNSNDQPKNWYGEDEWVFDPYEEYCYWCASDGYEVYITEKITEEWYFYYMDFDGNGHGLGV